MDRRAGELKSEAQQEGKRAIVATIRSFLRRQVVRAGLVFAGLSLGGSLRADVDLWGLGKVLPDLYEVNCVAHSGNCYYLGTSFGLLGIDMTDPTQPEYLGQEAWDMSLGRTYVEFVVAGNRLYGSYFVNRLWGDAQMDVIDIADPQNPQRLGTYIPITDNGLPLSIKNLTAVGSLVYAVEYGLEMSTETNSLVALNVSDPANPQRVGRCASSQHLGNMAVAGSYACVVEGTNTLAVVDLSSPTNLVRVGECQTTGSISGLSVVGRYAYVAGENGLEVIDISNPTSPQRMGGFSTNGIYKGMAVSGSYAYLAYAAKGLLVIDVSDPMDPQLVGGWDESQDGCRGLVVKDGIAYLAYANDGLVAVDVSDPRHPIWAGQERSPYYDRVSLAGNFIFVMDYHGFVESVVDVSHPANPVVRGRFETGARSYKVAVCGNHAFLAANEDGLQIVNVSDPAKSEWVGEYASGGWGANDVAVRGNYAYLADGNLEVIDVSNPASPQWVGGFDSDVRWVNLSGSFAYTIGKNILAILDISDPAHPQFLGNLLTTDWNFTCVTVQGNYAYVGAESGHALFKYGMHVIDVKDPANPQWLGWFETTSGWVYDVAVLGHYACLGASKELVVVDVADPTAPKRVSSFATREYAAGVEVMGNYAYVAVGDGGVEVIDLSDPAHPRRVSGNSSVVSAMDVAIDKGKVYLAAYRWGIEPFSFGRNGLSILEIVPFFKSMTPTNGRLDLSWENFGNAVLQRTASLGSPDWQLVPGSATTNRMTVPISSPGSEFFRLIKP